MADKHSNPPTQRGENRAQVFSFHQVQTAFRRLLEEEAELIQDDHLPPRTGLVAELFARMSFDCQQFIDRNYIGEEQAELVAKYCH